MTDAELMAKIKAEAGDAIATACERSSVPPAFLAGLIANETGAQFAESGLSGASNARRFEKGVLADLWEVLLGRKAAYGSIGRASLIAYVAKLTTPPSHLPVSLPGDALQRIDSLASSWGLTQVMGYHVLDPGSGQQETTDLILPWRCLAETIRILAGFAQRFQLDLSRDFPPLFTCWNTGSPNGKTFDPDYVEKGLRRMQLYSGLQVAAGANI